MDHGQNTNGHKTQDARSWLPIYGRSLRSPNGHDQKFIVKIFLVNMLTAAENIFQDFFNIFRLQLTLGK